MEEKAENILEFQVARKFVSDQNNTGIRLRKICTKEDESITAEATVLAKTTDEYEALRQAATDFQAEISCRGTGKSLKIAANGERANLNLLKFMAKIEKLEPEAKILVNSALEFIGEGDSALGVKISSASGANCDISIVNISLDNDLLLIDYAVKSDMQIEKADFFDALSKINKNEEIGIIK